MNSLASINLPRSPKILVRGVNWLGDAVMTMPALQRLREAQPDAQISLLSHEKLAGLWENHPFIDRLLTFTSNESLWKISRRLREKNFDVGLLFPNSPRSALELWLARIPQRIGYARAWRIFFLTRTIASRPGAVPMRQRSVVEIKRRTKSNTSPAPTALPAAVHHVHDYLHLVAALGASSEPIAPRIFIQNREAQDVAQAFRFFPLTDRPLVGLNPGAEYGPAKRWPAERFVAVAAELQKRVSCRWLIFGGAADFDLAEEIAQGIQRMDPARLPRANLVLNLAGKTSLRDLCVLLKSCRLLLTNDTGPMHVAAAVGTPVIALFGSTAPEFTAPGLAAENFHRIIRANVACAPCFRRECPIDFRCMKQIKPQQVVEVAAQVLARAHHPGSGL